MRDLDVANTINQQMNAIDRNLVWCMGVTKRRCISQGLQFEVSGKIFKGVVRIVLNGKDLYDVSLLKNQRNYYANELYGKKRYFNELKAIKTINDLYVEDLMGCLENEIENKIYESELES